MLLYLKLNGSRENGHRKTSFLAVPLTLPV